MSLVIEFFGRPGAGKTEIARRLAGRLERSGRRARLLGASDEAYRRAKLRCIAGYSFRRPAAAATDAVRIASTRQRCRRELVALTAHWLHKSETLRLAPRAGDAVILGGGPVHVLWSILYSARTPRVRPLAERLLELAPPRWLLVELCAEEAVAWGRVGTRRHPRSRVDRDLARDRAGTVEATAAAQSAVREIVRALAGARPGVISVASVDNGPRPLAEAVDDVVRHAETAGAAVRPAPVPTAPSA